MTKKTEKTSKNKSTKNQAQKKTVKKEQVEPKRNNPKKRGGESKLKESYEHHGWFNPKYNDSYLKNIAKLYEQGQSDIEVSTALGICKKTFAQWIKKHDEFAREVERGRELSEAWWRRLGRAGAAGVQNVNSALWFGNMKNRFGFRDRSDSVDEHSEEIKDIAKIVHAIKKAEKEY